MSSVFVGTQSIDIFCFTGFCISVELSQSQTSGNDVSKCIYTHGAFILLIRVYKMLHLHVKK